jgi:hypothetical protein
MWLIPCHLPKGDGLGMDSTSIGSKTRHHLPDRCSSALRVRTESSGRRGLPAIWSRAIKSRQRSPDPRHPDQASPPIGVVFGEHGRQFQCGSLAITEDRIRYVPDGIDLVLNSQLLCRSRSNRTSVFAAAHQRHANADDFL